MAKKSQKELKRRAEIKKITDNKTKVSKRKELNELSKDELITMLIQQQKHNIQLEKLLEKDEKELAHKDKVLEETRKKNNQLSKERNELLRQIANAAKKTYSSRDESHKKRKKKKDRKPADSVDSSSDQTEQKNTETAADDTTSGSDEQKKDSADQKKKKKVKHTKHDKSKDSRLPVKKRLLKDDPNLRSCPKCGHKMLLIGYRRVHTQKEIIPAQACIVETWTPVYYCPQCKKGTQSTVVMDNGPVVPIPGTTATSAVLLAWIIMMKFIFHLPYTRIEKQLKMTGDLRTTESLMSRHIIECSSRYFIQIVDYLIRQLRDREIVASDDTTCQVMREEGKKNTSTSRFWVFTTIPGAENPIKIVVYTPDRKQERPAEVLGEDFDGFLPCDCYAGYNVLQKAALAYCWVHLRREFLEAVPEPLKKKFNGSICDEAVRKIDAIFHMDHQIQESGTRDERKERRTNELKPLIDDFFIWLRKQKTENPAVKKAINYALNHEDGFKTCLKDPDIPLSNNVSERMVAPIVLGRKNWLFSGSPWGAMAVGHCYSLIQTAKANGLDPFLYLAYLLTVMPKCRRGEEPHEYTDEELEALMPWNEEVIRTCTPSETSGTLTEMCEKIQELSGFELCEDFDAEIKRRKSAYKQLYKDNMSGNGSKITSL